MKVCVDQDMCIGCGMCEGIAPEIFRLNGEGKAEVFAEGDSDSVREAIDGCPAEAIMSED